MLAFDDLWQVLAALVIFVITAIVQGIQKARRSKREAPPVEPGDWREAWDGGQPELDETPRPVPAPPAQTRRLPADGDWEAELRRLLGGEPQPAQPPPVPSVPPVVTRRTAEPAPEAWGESSPGHEVEPGYESAPAPATVLARMDESKAAWQRGSTSDAQAAQHLEPAGSFAASDAAFARAAGIHDRVVRQMNAAASLQARPAAASARAAKLGRGPALTARWRDRHTVQDAFIASVVLGPPRALEP